jgi:hypothetical protein
MADSYDTGFMGEDTPAQKLEQGRAIINSLRRLKDIQGQKLGSADWWKSQVSLDTPENQDAVDVGNDIAIGFTPGLGTLQAGRDFERSRREGSKLGMGLSALGMIPFFGGATKLVKGAGVGAKVKALRNKLVEVKGSSLSPEQIAGATPKVGKTLNLNGGVGGGELSDTVLRVPISDMRYERTNFTPGKPHISLDPQKMEGVAIPLPGDSTQAGTTLKSINGIPIDVRLDGGPGFMRLNNATWASMKPAASAYANRVNRTAESSGVPVNALFTKMAGKSADSNTASVDSLIQILRQTPLSGNKIKKLDSMVRSKLKDRSFPSLANIDALRARVMSDNGMNDRRGLFQTLAQAKAMDLHGIDLPSIRHAINEPGLIGQRSMSGGNVIARFDNPASIGKVSGDAYRHPSYDTEIRGGEYIGGFDKNVPMEIMFPDFAEWIKTHASYGNKAKEQKMFTVFAPPVQKIDSQWKDRMSQFLESK